MKLDLVTSFLQVDGELKIGMMMTEKDGSVRFLGHRLYGKRERIEIVMDKYQTEEIAGCEGIEEIYKCYKEMVYF